MSNEFYDLIFQGTDRPHEKILLHRPSVGDVLKLESTDAQNLEYWTIAEVKPRLKVVHVKAS